MAKKKRSAESASDRMKQSAISRETFDSYINQLPTIFMILQNNIPEIHQLEFHKGSKEEIRFYPESIQARFFEMFSLVDEMEPVRGADWSASPVDAATQRRFAAMHLGAMIGMAAGKFVWMLTDKKIKQLRNQPSWSKMLEMMTENIERVASIAEEVKLSQDELSDISKLRVAVVAHLQKNYRGKKVSTTSLYALTDEMKDSGRNFLRVYLANDPNRENLIKDVFRKPRQSDRYISDEPTQLPPGW